MVTKLAPKSTPRLRIGPRPPLPRHSERTLAFIGRFQDRRGYPPSFREIMRGTQQRSFRQVELELRGLEEQGYLEPRQNYRQIYHILRTPHLAPEAPDQTPEPACKAPEAPGAEPKTAGIAPAGSPNIHSD